MSEDERRRARTERRRKSEEARSKSVRRKVGRKSEGGRLKMENEKEE